ncbi:tetratricopeptide repeat protein [Streptomyces sp. NK08204]|uniref:tetratricopeptide repeat protein n=1 Tax=Streptomyces sp. NK08204 TaxID=2873260 RepID=UPI001CEC0F2F|nr:tetratricopeptide repeat protein [Streptomyces sp. NK08204]
MSGSDHIDFRAGTFNDRVTGKEEHHYHFGPAPTSLAALPGPPAFFTGRDDAVTELLATLAADGEESAPAVVISAVAGLGGVGKTALVLHVAHQAREQGLFPGGALFIDLRGYDAAPTTAEQAVRSLLRALGVRNEDMPPTPDEQYAVYRSLLAERDPVLIVLDNASAPDQIAPLLPGGGRGHRVLVTSRDVLDSLPVRQFRIEALGPDAARDLVQRLLTEFDPTDRRATEEPDALVQLCELCGRLPLALLIAVQLLRRRRHRPLATLTAELRRAADRARTLRARGVDQYGRELALRPVFDVMYARLEPELAEVFRLLGQAPGSDIGLNPAVCLTALRPEELEPLLDDLTAACLLTSLPGGARWEMHDLLRQYARAVAAEDPGLARAATEGRVRLLDYYLQGVQTARSLIRGRSGDVPGIFPRGLPHALGWLDSERSGLLGAALWSKAEDAEEAESAVTLALVLDDYLELRRAYDDWERLARNACEAARGLADSDLEAGAWVCRGLALRGLRRYEESIDAFHSARRIYAELADQRGQGEAWHGLGLSLHGLRRYEEATAAYRRSIDVYTALGSQGRAAGVRNNLGVLLEELGRLEEAHDNVLQSLEASRQLGDRFGEAAAQDILGRILRRLGRFEEAARAHARALALSAELRHLHQVASAFSNLGLTLQCLMRYGEAIAAHTMACATYKQINGGPAEAGAWGNLGLALLEARRLDEALSALGKAHSLYRRHNDWHGMGVASHNMAAVYERQSRSAKAMSALAAAAEAFERGGFTDLADQARQLAQPPG